MKGKRHGNDARRNLRRHGAANARDAAPGSASVGFDPYNHAPEEKHYAEAFGWDDEAGQEESFTEGFCSWLPEKIRGRKVRER